MKGCAAGNGRLACSSDKGEETKEGDLFSIRQNEKSEKARTEDHLKLLEYFMTVPL